MFLSEKLGGAALIAGFFLPTMIVVARGCPHRMRFFGFNALAGLTGVGWAFVFWCAWVEPGRPEPRPRPRREPVLTPGRTFRPAPHVGPADRPWRR